MRCITYGLVLIISCYLIEYTEAQNKNYKQLKDIENGSGERYTKRKEEKIYKGYKYKNNDIEDEEYKINKYDKQKCKGKGCDGTKIKERDIDSESTREEKYSKYTKKFNKDADDSEETPTYKKNRDRFEPKIGGNERNSQFKNKHKKDLIEDSDEELAVVKKQKTKKNNNEGFNKKSLSKLTNQKDEDNSSEEEKNIGSYKQINHKDTFDVDESEADTEEEKLKINQKIKKNIAKRIKKPIEESEENSVEVAKNKITNKNKMIRKQSTSSDKDSSEETNENDDKSWQNDKSEENEESDQSDDSDTDEEEVERTCKSKSRGKKCGKEGCGSDEQSDECDETIDVPLKNKKIKYSIKFAHEKQRISPSQDDHIMKKIHKEKKKYKYGDEDDDEDSSEEHIHPKRFQFIDEDEEE